MMTRNMKYDTHVTASSTATRVKDQRLLSPTTPPLEKDIVGRGNSTVKMDRPSDHGTGAQGSFREKCINGMARRTDNRLKAPLC
jgi:hypothetical protein